MRSSFKSTQPGREEDRAASDLTADAIPPGRRCGQCGAEMEAFSAGSLCPRCQLQFGVEPVPENVETPAPIRTGSRLPLELLDAAVQRMGWVGLALAVAAAGVYLAGSYVQPGWINPAQAPPSYRYSMWLSVLTGLTLFALAQSRILTTFRTLDLGLILQCAAGLFISLAENAAPRVEGEVVRGNSSVAVWIAIFALAVPVTFGKALLAAIATSAMGPLGLAVQIALGNVRNPPAPFWFALFSANVLLAVGATLLSKLIYRLGTQVKEAREFGGYQLLHPIARGGMGEVWLARHRLVGREAAIKVILEAGRGSGTGWRDDLRRRFGREARATASLHSPHTVSLYGYGVSEQGLPYYIMEVLDGLDLETLVTRFGPVPASRTVLILLQVCDSLAEAHEAGLTHRDIKPRNIMLCRLGVNCDFVKVLDFGLVKLHDSANPRNTSAVVAGTPSFLSPEVATGSPADARTDLYGVGCVAYWLLTGHPPFEAATLIAAALAHLKDTPIPPSRRTENEISPGLERIVLACLAKDPAERPQSARELANLLHDCQTGAPWTREKAEDWWRTQVPQQPAAPAGQRS